MEPCILTSTLTAAAAQSTIESFRRVQVSDESVAVHYASTLLHGVHVQPGSPYVLIENGLVCNDPALPVYDLEVLGWDVKDAEAYDELESLLERIHANGHCTDIPEETWERVTRTYAALAADLYVPPDDRFTCEHRQDDEQRVIR